MSAPSTFPGLIPGLAGGMSAQELVKARQQLLTPPSTAPSDDSTGERLSRLEALTANQAQEIFSLRRSSSVSREQAEGLRVCVAELEASLAGSTPAIRQIPFSINYSLSSPPAIGQAPFSINHPHSAGVQPKWETPVRKKKRSRFATFFEQMAAVPATSTPTCTADKKVEATPTSQVKRSQHAALLEKIAATSASREDFQEAVPILAATPSTEWTAHCNQMITPFTTPTRVDSYSVGNTLWTAWFRLRGLSSDRSL